MRVFFQGIGVLTEYNLGLTSALAKYENIDKIFLGTSQPLIPLLGYRRLLLNRKIRLVFTPFSFGTILYPKLVNLSEILHLNSTLDSCTDLILKFRKPKIFTLHEKLMKNHQKIIDTTDALVVPSKFMADTVHKKLGINSTVIHHGVDSQNFNPYIPRHIARKKLKLPSTSKIILWNGRITEQKDLLTFLEAISIISKQCKDELLFYIKGRAINKEYIRDILLKIRGLDEDFRKKIKLNSGWFPSSSLPYLYRSADLLVHTAIYESFGLVFIESMACGIPVIAAKAATAPEVLGDAGIFFAPRDPYDLAEKILMFLNDNRLRKKMSINGLKRIEKCRFTWKDAANKYTSLYLSLL